MHGADVDPGRGMGATDARLLQRLRDALPLLDRPFAAVGAELGLGEDEVIERLQHLLAHGVLTRFGPQFDIERAGGSALLGAMQVPEQGFDAVAAAVIALREVTHSHRRDHLFNLWFVLAAETWAEVQAAVARIEDETGLPVLRLALERDYVAEMAAPGPGAASGKTAAGSADQAGRGHGAG